MLLLWPGLEAQGGATRQAPVVQVSRDGAVPPAAKSSVRSNQPGNQSARKSSRVSGRVVDEQGMPVVGARLQISLGLYHKWRSMTPGFLDEPGTVTGANGTFDWSGAPTEGPFYLGAELGSRMTSDALALNLRPGEHRSGLELCIVPHDTIRGRVVGRDGSGLSQMRVWFSDSGTYSRTGFTGPEGEFEIKILPGTYRASVSHPHSGGPPPQSFEGVRSPQSDYRIRYENEVSGIPRFTTHTVFLLEGRVLDLETNQPISGFDVQWAQGTGKSGLDMGMAPKEPGSFAVELHVSGEALKIEAPGYGTHFTNSIWDREGSGTVRKDFRLGRPTAVQGTIVNSQGVGVEGVDVGLVPSGYPTASPASGLVFAARDRTGTDGKFLLSGMGPGRYVLRVSPNHHGIPQDWMVELKSGQKDNRGQIVVGAGADLNVRVAPNSQGKLPAEVRVDVRTPMGGTMQRHADADGAVAYSGLTPGEYTITAYIQGYRSAPKTVVLKHGESSETALDYPNLPR